MLAVTYPRPGIVALAPHPDPVPSDHQVLVAVRAGGLNRADLLQCAGRYPAPPGWPATWSTRALPSTAWSSSPARSIFKGSFSVRATICRS